MLTKEFNFDLPEELIAQSPSEKRGGDRLLILDKQSGKLEDRLFTELPEILPKNALMVFNNSKVRHARIYGKSKTNAVCEFLMINPMKDSDGLGRFHLAGYGKKSKTPKTREDIFI